MRPYIRSRAAARLIAIGFVVASAGAPARARQPAKKDPGLAKEAYNLLKAKCSKCHGDGARNAGLDVLRWDGPGGMVQKDGAGRVDEANSFIVPEKPKDSKVYTAVASDYMPYGGTPLTAAEKDLMRRWIEGGGGYPTPNEYQPRQFLPDATVIEAIVKDLINLSEKDKKYARYLSFAHLWNNPEVQLRDLDLYRAGLAKLLNGLSFRRGLVVPVPIDPPYNTIYRIDLRDLVDYQGRNWYEAGYWQRLLAVYPYGLVFVGTQASNFRLLTSQTSTSLPYVRADWFVFAAARPNPYYELLALPDNAEVLEKRLKVDIRSNFVQNRLVRGGLLIKKSGVSSQNRLVERHETEFGAYWKSYDFKASFGRGDLSVFPLGPSRLGFPKEDSFRHNGGEIIFTLPNGLQAYMLVDELDNRINIGPEEIVSDPRKFSGRTAIFAGVSCMGCHQQGTIKCRDEIRGLYVAQAGNSLKAEKVLDVFPEQKVLDDYVARDRAQFLRALRACAAPFVNPGKPDDQVLAAFGSKPARELTAAKLDQIEAAMLEQIGQVEEPTTKLSLFYDRPVTYTQAAAEIGMAEPTQLKLLGKLTYFRDRGLSPWAVDQPIDRAVWERIFKDVVFAVQGLQPLDLKLNDKSLDEYRKRFEVLR